MSLDFLGIGTTRSGTTFLHQQLCAHPGIWLPPEKEIQYLNWQRPLGIFNRRQRAHLLRILPHLRQALRGKRGALRELLWQARYHLGPRTDSWFLSLYEVPGIYCVGQVEPTYAILPEAEIRHLQSLAPDVRLIFMMRDPIDRAWSSVVKSTAQNKGRPMPQVADAAVYEKLDRSAIAMSSYIRHIETWEQVFPKERFCFGFFEEVKEQPQELLERVERFIGVDPLDEDERPGFEPVNDTRRFTIGIPARFEHYLAERLLEPTRRLERRFGGYTGAWLERIERVLARPASNLAG